jgi:hypothetical protein
LAFAIGTALSVVAAPVSIADETNVIQSETGIEVQTEFEVTEWHYVSDLIGDATDNLRPRSVERCGISVSWNTATGAVWGGVLAGSAPGCAISVRGLFRPSSVPAATGMMLSTGWSSPPARTASISSPPQLLHGEGMAVYVGGR